jgi:hypothetical protein
MYRFEEFSKSRGARKKNVDGSKGHAQDVFDATKFFLIDELKLEQFFSSKRRCS